MNKMEFLHRPILRIRVRDYHIYNTIFIGWEYHNFSYYLDINVHQLQVSCCFFNAINIIETLVLALTKHCLSGSPYSLTEILGLALTLFYVSINVRRTIPMAVFTQNISKRVHIKLLHK